jgi:beta-galactosidase
MPYLSRFHGLGGAFYPEEHSPDTWPIYAQRLREAGLSFVRLGEFAWDRLEPAEGCFDFAWLDAVLAHLDRHNITAVLCTPTAVPPQWACAAYPDIHPVTGDGRVMGFGGRRYTCPTSPNYLRLGTAIAAAMGGQFGNDPRVLAWQLDNEFGHPFCFCPRCQGAFQAWCRARFGAIEAFNDALCLHFWGQTLSDFDQVWLPTTYGHPGLWQLYHQWFSTAIIACYRQQAAALSGVQQPVTTNMMPTWYGYDHEAMGASLDVIAGDHYGLQPETLFGEPFLSEAFVNAYLRGIRHGQNPWFLEFQWGRTCSRISLPLPGQVRWETLTQVGLGADLISYFRFDAVPNGAERDAFNLVDERQQPGRIFAEVASVAGDLDRLRPLLDASTPAPAEAAVLFDYANHVEFAHSRRIPEMDGPSGNGYSMHLARHFGALTRQNIPCDVVYPGADLAPYRVLIVPALYVCTPERAASLDAFVTDGGTLLLTSLSGVVDACGTLHQDPAPGPLAAFCGVAVRDAAQPHPAAGPVRFVSDALNLALDDVRWIDEVQPADDVEVLARFANPFYDGIPALTRRRHGQGVVYYLGALLSPAGYAALYRALAAAWDLQPLMTLPDGVYVTERRQGDNRLRFLNNPAATAVEVPLPAPCTDVLTGETLAGTITLPPFTVRVVQ